MIATLLKQLSQALTWFFVVAPWEQALRVRMGKRVQKLGAGIYFKVPFVDRVYKQSVRRRLAMIRAQTLTTTDGKVVTCSGAVGFSVGDLEKLFDTLESPNDTIENEVAAIIARFIGSRPLSECGSTALEEFVQRELNLSRYGLDGQEFYTVSFATTRTYRMITGDLATWQRDEGLCMKEDSAKSQALNH